MAEHPEHHDHAEHGHDHGHPHEHPLVVTEESLDPANQSLADALRLSFRALKAVMVILIGLFMISGIVMVDQKEVVVISRFGQLVGEPREPGLHFAWPYPIDEQIKVSTSLQTLPVRAFWLNLSERDQTKSLSDLAPRGRGLEPGVDGALITGDRALMHLLLKVEYSVASRVRLRADRTEPAEQISDVMLFVQNVGELGKDKLLQAVIQDATVAEAGRRTADIIWKDPMEVAIAVMERAQQALDRMETGIVLEKVVAEQSYFPLQARDEFLSVSQAENLKRQLINDAESDRTKKLVGVAGEAWEAIKNEIERLDQVTDEGERSGIINRIEEILVDDAKGEAGGKIQMANKDRERILDEAIAEVARFNAYLDEYRLSPELVRRRLRTEMLNDLFDQPGVTKWWMPSGDKRLILTINRDPEEIREAEADAMKKKTEKR
ncbi:MAG TPA: SPFH domain-containing protein [Phycisphaerae bacterium]|nr:SPFH domain-containing protein [Phycisphaerae bacterium]